MNPDQTAEATELRQRAEEHLHCLMPSDDAPLSANETQRLIHELQVHQIELEMQSEELRRTQAVQEASLARYADLFDFAPVGFMTISATEQIQEANLSAATLLGITRNALVGQSLTRFILPEDVDIYRNHFMQLFEAGEKHACELRLLPPGRTPFWVRLKAAVVIDGEGGEPVYHVVIYDISERRQAEALLRKSEERFELLAEQSHSIIWEVNATGLYTYISRVVEQVLGYRADDIVGKMHFYDLHPEEGREAFKVAAFAVFERKDPFVGLENPLQTLDGCILCVSTNGIPTLDDNGALLGYYGSDTDITDRKRAEEELRCINQIMISQSRHAAMGEMVGNIAHQWRQPLNNIGLIIQYLQRICHSSEISTEELKKEFNEAFSNIKHMSNTIDDFRSFFSPNKPPQPFSVAKAIDQALALTNAYFSFNRIQVDMQTEDDLTANGFQNEYTQVVLNLVKNASDQLTEQHVADPRITIRSFTRDGRSVTIIHDNGGGIPDDIIERIFDSYFTTKPEATGTGIGLYISKTIIEKHMGGSLTVTNRDGGAEFRIEV